MPAEIQKIETASIADEIAKKKKQEIVRNGAVRLSDFVLKNHISQRAFRTEYGVDITNLRLWISGQRGMNFETIDKIEHILSSGPVVV